MKIHEVVRLKLSKKATVEYKSVSLQPDKRSVTQETEEAEKQCIAFVS